MPVATTAQLNTAVANFLKSNSSLAALYRTATPATVAAAAKTNPQLQSALAGFLPGGTTVAAPVTAAKTPAPTAQGPAPALLPTVTKTGASTAFTLPDPVAQLTQIWSGNIPSSGKTITDPATGTTYYLSPTSLKQAQWYAVPKGSAIASPVNNPTTNPSISNTGGLTVSTLNKNVANFFASTPTGATAAAKSVADAAAAKTAGQSAEAATAAYNEAQIVAKQKADAETARMSAEMKALEELKAKNAELAKLPRAEQIKAKQQEYQTQLSAATTQDEINEIAATASSEGFPLTATQIESASTGLVTRLADGVNQDFLKSIAAGTVTQDQIKTYQDSMKELGRPASSSYITSANQKIADKTQQSYTNQLLAATSQDQLNQIVSQAKGANVNFTSTQIASASNRIAANVANAAKTAEFIKANKPTGATSGLSEIGRSIYSLPDNPATAIDESGWYEAQSSTAGKYNYQKIGADGRPTGPVIPDTEFTKTRNDLSTQVRNYQTEQATALKTKTDDYKAKLGSAESARQFNDIVAQAQADGVNLSKSELASTGFANKQYSSFIQAQNAGTITQDQLDSYVKTMADIGQPVNQYNIDSAQKKVDYNTQQVAAAKKQAEDQASQRQAQYVKTAEWLKTADKPSGLQTSAPGEATLYSMPDNPATADVDEGGYFRLQQGSDGRYSYQKIGADGAPTGPVIPDTEFTKTRSDLLTQSRAYATEQANILKTKTADYRSRLDSAESAKQYNDVIAEGQADGIDLSRDPYSGGGFRQKQYSAFIQAQNDGTLTQDQLDNYVKTMADIGQPVPQNNIDSAQQRVDYRAQQDYSNQLRSATSQDQINAIVNKAKDTRYAIPDFQVKSATDRVARQEATYAKVADFVKTAKPTGQQAGLTEFGYTIYSLPDDPTTKANEGGWYTDTGDGVKRIGADGRPTGPVVPFKEFDTQNQTIKANAYNYQIQQTNTTRMNEFLAAKSALESKLPAPGSDGWMRGGYKDGPGYVDAYNQRKISLT